MKNLMTNSSNSQCSIDWLGDALYSKQSVMSELSGGERKVSELTSRRRS
jgi:hypothetical protein